MILEKRAHICMNALVLKDVNKIELTDVAKPIPDKGEVLVKVMAAGVCGSDIPRAYRDGAHNMPLIIGHEFAGIVENVSEGVSESWINKRVGVFPLIPCRSCKPCRGKKYEMCKNYSYLGSRRDGGFAEYVAVPEWNLIELPDNVSYEAAAMLEPMAVATHAMRRVGVTPEDTVVVCGLGTIGTLLTMFLIDRGVKRIITVGNKEFQKKTVMSLGIPEEYYCDSRVNDSKEFINKLTDNEGADVFFECVGRNETVSLAVDSVGASGRICYVGNPASDMTFEKNIYWKILRNQITVTGTWNSSYYGEDESAAENAGGIETSDDWHYVLERLMKGTINPEKLITHKYPLSELTKGMEIMRDKSEDYIKVMYVFGD